MISLAESRPSASQVVGVIAVVGGYILIELAHNTHTHTHTHTHMAVLCKEIS